MGSPNMGIKEKDYKKYLHSICQELNIEKNIIFHGFVERTKLYEQVIPKTYCFISLSLHSDENFGMALLTSLAQGAASIVSDWGGHKDFAHSFKKKVQLIPVHQGQFGPCCDLNKVITAILSYTESDKLMSPNLPPCFSQKHQEKLCLQSVQKIKLTGGPLIKEKSATKVLQSKEKFINKSMQIFKDYTDPLLSPLFEAYGMKKKPPLFSQEGLMLIAPWVNITPGFIHINNPHFGKISIKRKNSQNEKSSVHVKDHQTLNPKEIKLLINSMNLCYI